MLTARQAKAEKARRFARGDLLAFLQFCWWMPHKLLIGSHTVAVCNRLTRAVEDLKAGKSTFLIIAIPFRHGKSDLVSRALPAWFLGTMREHEPDVIMSGYGASLVQGFSRKVKSIITGRAFQELFPGLLPARGSNSAAEWQVCDSAGQVTATGLGGAVTGKGGVLITLDDYCKSRAEARSKVYRDKTWDAFTNDLLTRRAPEALVVVCATPWNIDDVRGRIKAAMADDPDFPQFEELKFPARNEDGSFLFSKRFSDEWYKSQYATLGSLAAGLLDCEPNFEGGNRFAVDRIVIHKTTDGWPSGRSARAWDLASSAKERDKDDPDWTVGVRGFVQTRVDRVDGDVIRRQSMWVDDLVCVRAEAPERDVLIRKTALQDGGGVRQVVEAFGAYKDAYTTLKALLRGTSIVMKSHLPGDKSVKAAPLEPVIEAGELHLLRAQWNDFLIDHLTSFPDGPHDDAVDALAVLYHACAGGSGAGMVIPR